MNRALRIATGALACAVLLCAGGILTVPLATAAAPAKRQSAATVPAAPENGGPRNWQVAGVSGALNMRERPSATAKVLARFPAGTIFDNLGCRRAEARVWCDVQPLGGGPRGFVAAEFLKPAVSPDGSVATGVDDSALRAGQGKFDASGAALRAAPGPAADEVRIRRCPRRRRLRHGRRSEARRRHACDLLPHGSADRRRHQRGGQSGSLQRAQRSRPALHPYR